MLKVDFSKLTFNSPDFQRFEKLISPDKYSLLEGKDPYGISNTEIVGVQAEFEERPVGLILASFQKIIKVADVHHLFVLPEFRNQHIGTSLIKQLQVNLKQKQARALEIVYEQGAEYTSFLEKILQKTGWLPPTLFLLRCKYLGKAFHPKWIDYPLSFPADFEEIPWSSLTPQELKSIQTMGIQGAYPDILSPFYEKDSIEPLNSLALRQGEEIVGWMVTHRVQPDTIRYTSFFMAPHLRRQSYSSKLLIDAIHLQKKSEVKWAIFELPITQVHSSWSHFIRKRLVPFADEVKTLNQACFLFYTKNG